MFASEYTKYLFLLILITASSCSPPKTGVIDGVWARSILINPEQISDQMPRQSLELLEIYDKKWSRTVLTIAGPNIEFDGGSEIFYWESGELIFEGDQLIFLDRSRRSNGEDNYFLIHENVSTKATEYLLSENGDALSIKLEFTDEFLMYKRIK